MLVALATVPWLASCSAGPGPAAPRLGLDKLWESPFAFDAGSGIDYLVDRLSLLGDTVMLAEGAGNTPTMITALDAETGALRWSRPVGRPITAPTVGRVMISGAGPAAYGAWEETFQNPVLGAIDGILPVAYADGGTEATSGVIGLDLRTGEPVWGFAAVTEPSNARTMITAVAASVVIMTVAPAIGPGWPPADQPVITIAVDGRTGRRLWTAPDLLGLGADGDVVIAAKREQRSAGQAAWIPYVLDARTGAARWTGPQELGHPSDFKAAAAGYAVFAPNQVIQLATGTPIDYAEPHRPMPVACDPPLLVWDTGVDWWSAGPNGFLTRRLPEGKPEAGRKRPGGLEFVAEAGVGPHIWGHYSDTQSTSDSEAGLVGVVAVDRTGGPRSPSVKGMLAGVDDHRLVVVSTGMITVHRITPA